MIRKIDKMKDLKEFIIQFVHHGHGNAIGRLNSKEIKCGGCEEDVNAIIEAVEEYKLKEVEKVIDKEIKRMENLMSDPKLKMHKDSEVASKLRHYKQVKILIRGK